MFAFLFKGVTDKLICTSVFKNYSFFSVGKFFIILYTFLCNLWKRNVLVNCILNDAYVMIPPVTGLQNLKIMYLLLKFWLQGIRNVRLGVMAL